MTGDFTSLTYPAKSKKVATIRRFEDLRAWQKARELAKDTQCATFYGASTGLSSIFC